MNRTPNTIPIFLFLAATLGFSFIWKSVEENHRHRHLARQDPKFASSFTLRTVVVLALFLMEGLYSHAAWMSAKLSGIPPCLRYDLQMSTAWCKIAESLLRSTSNCILQSVENQDGYRKGDMAYVKKDLCCLFDSAHALLQHRAQPRELS